MDVLETRTVHVCAKDEVFRVFGVSVPGTHTITASDTAACPQLRTERTQHIRSTGFTRSHGRCRSAIHRTFARMRARA
jgi:hypothetical protein